MPALVPSPGAGTLASVILFYDSDNTPFPEVFRPFTDIPVYSSTLGFKTLAQFADELGQMVIDNIKYASLLLNYTASPAN